MSRRTTFSDIAWPAIPEGLGPWLMALMYQVDQSQWWAPGELERHQFQVLREVLGHAVTTVPYYREHDAYRVLAGGGSITAEAWAGLPVLTRADAQEAGAALVSQAIPPDHLPTTETHSSGSTGRPLRAVGTQITGLFWLAITLREHLWHRRDFSAKLASIRVDTTRELPSGGAVEPHWGRPVSLVADSGPCVMLSIQRDVPAQAEWLVRHNPDYLLSLPSNVLALARHFQAEGLKLPRLREVRSVGELLGPEVRPACQETWGVKVTDTYSTSELGYIALQCPDGELYHLQSEVVRVEVLDENGRPCQPGQIGRVVVSALHNFAMPLLRYDTGDYAEVGGPCACGRGLPVLTRIAGRRRNLMTLPSGERVMPLFGDAWRKVDAIRQFQIVQRDIDHFEARIVAVRPLTAEEEANFTSALRRKLGYSFEVSFSYIDRVDRSESLKFEDFISLVPSATT